MTCAPGFPLRFQPLERLWRGLKRRNPPPGSLLAVGWKLFASSLAVSPRAGSGNSRLSRSRGNRHGRLGRNSLGGDRQHYERKNSTGEDGSEGKFWRGRRGRCKRSPRPFYRSSLSPGEQFCGRNACPMEKVQTLASGISWVSAHKPVEFVFAKRRLEQVRPDSAFWSSEMSMEVTWKPRASPCARKRRGEDDGIDESKGIGGMRLSWIDVDPFMAGERRDVKPCAVGKERVAAEMRDGRLQMKAAGDGNGDDFIAVRRKNGGKLADAFRVAAPGEADEELSGDAKNVATFESAGKRNVFELSKLGERLSKRRRLAAAGLRSERQDHRQFIENDSGVFDEHGVGKGGLGGERNDASAQFAEKLLVGVVLLLGCGQIDGLAIDEGKFAIDDGWADGTRDGCKHSDRESLHENGAR